MDGSLIADQAAVAAMTAGDPAGLEAVYRRYADRLYAYARSIVVDADTAADVVQETFLVAAQRVGQLRDPQRLSSWLYAIARNECLARLRARKRTVLLAESPEPVLDTDPGRALHTEQVKELVHAAAAGMNAGDREVFELTVRHGLSAADVARVLDISDKHAHARISRVRDQFEGALGALVVARDGPGRCEQLDAILQGWDGQLTALLRKRIERHTRDCQVCSARRRERMNPAGLLAGYAALPFFAVAAQLWPRVQGGGGIGVSRVHGGESPGASKPPTVPLSAARSGAPGPSTKALVIGAAAAVLLIILGTSAVRLLTLDRPSSLAAQPASPSPSPSPSPTPSSSPTPSPSLTASSSPTPSLSPAGVFTLSAGGQWVCATVPAQFRITAQAGGTRLREATAHYTAPVLEQTMALDVDGFQAQVQFTPGSYVPEITWWVVAESIDGRDRTTAPVLVTNPC